MKCKVSWKTEVWPGCSSDPFWPKCYESKTKQKQTMSHITSDVIVSQMDFFNPISFVMPSNKLVIFSWYNLSFTCFLPLCKFSVLNYTYIWISGSIFLKKEMGSTEYCIGQLNRSYRSSSVFQLDLPADKSSASRAFPRIFKYYHTFGKITS